MYLPWDTLDQAVLVRQTGLSCIWLTLRFTIYRPLSLQAQNVADVLILAAQDPKNVATMVRGAASLIPNAIGPYTTTGSLPQCLRSNVLLNSGGFPKGWASLSAEQQASHPINLVMMQLAYAAYHPRGTFTGK